MTIKETIEILSKDLGKYVLMEHDEAILTAIDALEERPQGDLISRSALLADFKERNIWSKDILEAIDNAPTIAVNCKECDGYEAGYAAGLKDAERPKGEWILNKDENPECPFCHHSFTYFGNFCSNCGADMR